MLFIKLILMLLNCKQGTLEKKKKLWVCGCLTDKHTDTQVDIQT